MRDFGWLPEPLRKGPLSSFVLKRGHMPLKNSADLAFYGRRFKNIFCFQPVSTLVPLAAKLPIRCERRRQHEKALHNSNEFIRNRRPSNGPGGKGSRPETGSRPTLGRVR